jgi:hypothetical protein
VIHNDTRSTKYQIDDKNQYFASETDFALWGNESDFSATKFVCYFFIRSAEACLNHQITKRIPTKLGTRSLSNPSLGI